MNYLVADIGNTLSKFCIINSKSKIIKIYQVETDKLNYRIFLNNFFRKLFKNKIKNKILFSSVVPKVFKKIRYFLNENNFKPYEIKELNLKKLIKINIKKYNQLGSDRIANAIGSFSEHQTNCLIIDFGTATTFDIVKKPGSYEGGVIAPGVKLSITNLNKSTASLPIFDLKFSNKNYGKNTKDALNAGFLWGYQGLIINIIRKIKETFKCKFQIIFTGGYSKIFSKIIDNNKVTIDPNITIKGIIYIYKNLII